MAARQNLTSRLSDIPTGAATSIKRGFVLISKMSHGQRIDFTDRVIDTLLAGRQMSDVDDIASDLTLDISETRDAMNAVSSVVGLLSDSEESLESFLEITYDKLYAPEFQDTARELASLAISKRPQLKRSLDLYSLAAQTLPSLRTCSITVDLRPKFEDRQIVDAIAIALLHIDTDVQPEIFMQLTKSDIKFIQARLSDALHEMETAETLYTRKG